MVRILANGEIVRDDDPRARASQPTQRPNVRVPPRQVGLFVWNFSSLCSFQSLLHTSLTCAKKLHHEIKWGVCMDKKEILNFYNH